MATISTTSVGNTSPRVTATNRVRGKEDLEGEGERRKGRREKEMRN